MSNLNYDYVEAYVRGLYKEQDPFLCELESLAEREHIPIIEKESLALLLFMVELLKPRKILEIGTAIGYSSIQMAFACEEASIISIEKREKMASMAKEHIEQSGLSSRIQVIESDAVLALSELNDHFDLIFIDAAKGHYQKFFDLSIDKLNEGGVIISDNVLFRGMVCSMERTPRRMRTIHHRMNDYLDYLTTHEDLTTSIVPLGDGMALTCKKRK